MRTDIWVHLLIGACNVLPGMLMLLVDTDSPNRWMGYRTPASMKSDQTWAFANKLATKGLLWFGLIATLIHIFLFSIIDNSETVVLVVCGLMTLGFLIIFGVIELKLSNFFDKDGHPKQKDKDLF